MKISSIIIFFSILFINHNTLYADEMDNISIDEEVITETVDGELSTRIVDTFYGYECVVVNIEEKVVCVGVYEVPQEMWQKVMKSNPAHFKSDPKNPVENVTANDVNNFITKFNKLSGLKYRLMSYDEWAVVAEDDIERLTTLNPAEICSQFNLYDKSSDKINRFGNKPYPCDDTYPYTAPVDTFEPNNLGIYNLVGNVAEWTSTLTSKKGQRYVAGWSFSDSNINVEKPDSRSFENRFGGLGFRLVLDVESDKE